MERCSIQDGTAFHLCQDEVVTVGPQRSERRSDALSKARIVRAAVETLDDGGIEALTFRALASRLSTGAGAIYHHVTNKNDLLAAAVDDLMGPVLAREAPEETPRDVRAVMLAAFDAIVAHPWLGTQLVAAPWQPVVFRLLECVGTGLSDLGVPADAQFDAASVLVHHLLGVASQYDAGRALEGMQHGRTAFLDSARLQMIQGDPTGEHPFMARIAQQLAEHDDREQFGAGVDIILAGVATL